MMTQITPVKEASYGKDLLERHKGEDCMTVDM